MRLNALRDTSIVAENTNTAIVVLIDAIKDKIDNSQSKTFSVRHYRPYVQHQQQRNYWYKYTRNKLTM